MTWEDEGFVFSVQLQNTDGGLQILPLACIWPLDSSSFVAIKIVRIGNK